MENASSPLSSSLSCFSCTLFLISFLAENLLLVNPPLKAQTLQEISSYIHDQALARAQQWPLTFVTQDGSFVFAILEVVQCAVRS